MRFRAFQLPAVAFPLLMFLALSGAPAARAALSMTGGTASQQDLLARVYGTFPACCQSSRPVRVCLLDDRAMNTCLQAAAATHAQRLVNAAAVDGFYLNSSPTITLRVPSGTTDVSATFAHEYGHFVWMNVLSATQRDRYRSIYASQRAAGHLVSQYAAVSVEEGFAEAFSCYIQRRPVLAQKDFCSCCFLDGLS